MGISKGAAPMIQRETDTFLDQLKFELMELLGKQSDLNMEIANAESQSHIDAIQAELEEVNEAILEVSKEMKRARTEGAVGTTRSPRPAAQSRSASVKRRFLDANAAPDVIAQQFNDRLHSVEPESRSHLELIMEFNRLPKATQRKVLFELEAMVPTEQKLQRALETGAKIDEISKAMEARRNQLEISTVGTAPAYVIEQRKMIQRVVRGVNAIKQSAGAAGPRLMRTDEDVETRLAKAEAIASFTGNILDLGGSGGRRPPQIPASPKSGVQDRQPLQTLDQLGFQATSKGAAKRKRESPASERDVEPVVENLLAPTIAPTDSEVTKSFNRAMQRTDVPFRPTAATEASFRTVASPRRKVPAEVYAFPRPPARVRGPKKLKQRYGEKLQSEGGVLEDIYQRAGSWKRGKSRKSIVQSRAGASELSVILRYLKRADVEKVIVVKAKRGTKKKSGGAADITVVFKDGTTSPLEVTSVTSAPTAKEIKKQEKMRREGLPVAKDLQEMTGERPPTMEMYKSAIRRKAVPLPPWKGKLQIEKPREGVEGPGIIAIHAPFGKVSDLPMIRKALQALESSISPRAQRIEFSFGRSPGDVVVFERVGASFVQR
ncbi:MAG: hypothetical protein L0387_46015 [Acidobacteria bacterium]|nr:hypothetical protein [Acidobacteriota bacterium]